MLCKANVEIRLTNFVSPAIKCDSREPAMWAGVQMSGLGHSSLRVTPGPLIGHRLPLLASDWLVVTWADQAGPG